MTAGEAKEFVISRIIAEANREDVSLTDTEQQMLWWTEVHPEPHIPDLKRLAERFDSECDSDEYETKMKGLLNAARNNATHEKQRWDEAVRAIEKEDHYLGVILMGSGQNSAQVSLPIVNRFLAVVIFVVVLIGVVMWLARIWNP